MPKAAGPTFDPPDQFPEAQAVLVLCPVSDATAAVRCEVAMAGLSPTRTFARLAGRCAIRITARSWL